MLLRCEEGQQHNPLNAVPVCECVCMCVFLCEWCVCVCVCVCGSREMFLRCQLRLPSTKNVCLHFQLTFYFYCCCCALLHSGPHAHMHTHAYLLRLVQLMRDALRFLCTWRGATSSNCFVVSANIEQAFTVFQKSSKQFQFLGPANVVGTSHVSISYVCWE